METRQITFGILIIAALFIIICRKMMLNYDVNFDGQMLGVMVHLGRQRLKRKVNSREIWRKKGEFGRKIAPFAALCVMCLSLARKGQ